jgi:hypothetical protein
MTSRKTAGALLALLLFVVARPSGARAGCAYAHVDPPGRGAAHLERLALAGALSMPTDDADPPAPVPPCAGLHCSNDPAPASPASPVIGPVGEHWVCLSDLASGRDLTSTAFPSDDPAVRPRYRVASPFHPPR